MHMIGMYWNIFGLVSDLLRVSFIDISISYFFLTCLIFNEKEKAANDHVFEKEKTVDCLLAEYLEGENMMR
jgi:hypothetical protein